MFSGAGCDVTTATGSAVGSDEGKDDERFSSVIKANDHFPMIYPSNGVEYDNGGASHRFR